MNKKAKQKESALPKKRYSAIKTELYDAYCDIMNFVEQNYGRLDINSAYDNAKKRCAELDTEKSVERS